MAIAKGTAILILCFALANYADAVMKPRPPIGPDIYHKKNVAKDVLLPGEKVVNVMDFGAKPDGEFDSTQVIKLKHEVAFFWLINYAEFIKSIESLTSTRNMICSIIIRHM